MNIRLIYLLLICTLTRAASVEVAKMPPPCPLEQTCRDVNATSGICLLDEAQGCIRKYASKCHLEIAACRARENYTDYSDVYCEMEPYICEEEYERWTIFFGHESD